MLPRLNFTPAMVVAVKTLHLAAIVRLTLSPVLHDAPFVGGFSFCFLDLPYLDFDLRCGRTKAVCRQSAPHYESVKCRLSACPAAWRPCRIFGHSPRDVLSTGVATPCAD